MGDRPGPLALALSSCTWNCAGPPIKGPRKAGIDKAHGTPISRARGGAPYPGRISITRATRGAAAAEGTALRAQPPIARRGGHGEGRYLQHPCRPALQCGGAGCSEGNYPPSCGPAANPPASARENRSRGTVAAAAGTIRSNRGPESRKLKPVGAAAATAPAACSMNSNAHARTAHVGAYGRHARGAPAAAPGASYLRWLGLLAWQEGVPGCTLTPPSG